MEIEVTTRERNDLMNREQIELRIEHGGESTPSENTVRKQLAAELDLDPLTISVDHIHSSQGTPISRGMITVFDEPIMDELPEENDEPAEDDSEAEDAEAESETDNEADEEDAGDESEAEETEEPDDDAEDTADEDDDAADEERGED